MFNKFKNKSLQRLNLTLPNECYIFQNIKNLKIWVLSANYFMNSFCKFIKNIDVFSQSCERVKIIKSNQKSLSMLHYEIIFMRI